MKLLSRICALAGAVAFFASTLVLCPSVSAAPKAKHGGKMATVHGYTRQGKNGKMITVKGYTRNAAGSKTVSVKGYTRKGKNGKLITVKGYKRAAPGKGKKGGHKTM
jgi:hypothetical protein